LLLIDTISPNSNSQLMGLITAWATLIFMTKCA
jgi:hypothetical protein